MIRRSPESSIYSTKPVEHAIAGIKRLGCMTQILRNRRPFIDDIAKRLNFDYII
ncbi:hypothetical protein [Symbiopectobacterium purcellii]|uniref:hypothetical protein n=1 Tax=Symbiopectobacterium purcellii TaxID=2871826 RepID=UPI003F8341FC